MPFESIAEMSLPEIALIGGIVFGIVIFGVTRLKKPRAKVMVEGEIDIDESVWVFAGEGNGSGYDSHGDKAIADSSTNSLKNVRLKDGTVLPHVSINDVRYATNWDVITKNKSVMVMCRIDRFGVPRAWALPPELKAKLEPSKLFKERMKKKVQADLLEGFRFKEKVGGEVSAEEPFYGRARMVPRERE